ncbi:MAG TPA: hypothetical protein VFN10_03545 [Thermoanaerobaculia bacterium]|nr:hypothetical protein [Thermoanaerobaculia bacterium]
MSEIAPRVCVGCGDSEEVARLESCSICRKAFCADCAHRALGRRFCSVECGRTYYFLGDDDDDEDDAVDE